MQPSIATILRITFRPSLGSSYPDFTLLDFLLAPLARAPARFRILDTSPVCANLEPVLETIESNGDMMDMHTPTTDIQKDQSGKANLPKDSRVR